MSLGSDGPYDCIATEYKLHSRNAIRAFFNDRPNPIRSDIPLLSFSQSIGREVEYWYKGPSMSMCSSHVIMVYEPSSISC